MEPVERKAIIIVNGHPRSGKDTVVGMMSAALGALGWRTGAVSSIDPVREMLRGIGIPVDRKSKAERDLMAGVKACLDAYDWWATRTCLSAALELLDLPGKVAVFLHVRESEAIQFIKDKRPDGIEFLTIFVDRPDAERVTSNAADAGVEDYFYDVRLKNDASLTALSAHVCDLAASLNQSPWNTSSEEAA